MWREIGRHVFQKKPGIDPFSDREAALRVAIEETAESIRRIFRRSVRIRQVDAGSCNACEWECTALANPVYDVQRFGIDFVASPRHADIVLVTGPVSRSMVLALKQTIRATPEPRLIVGLGDCTKDGGVFRGSYAVTDGLGNVVPVDGWIGGCPPSPLEIIRGLAAILQKRLG